MDDENAIVDGDFTSQSIALISTEQDLNQISELDEIREDSDRHTSRRSNDEANVSLEHDYQTSPHSTTQNDELLKNDQLIASIGTECPNVDVVQTNEVDWSIV